MTSHVEVQDSAALVFNNEEAIQKLECQRRHCEEIERDDCLTMIGEESEPALAWIGATSKALKISGDSAFGNFKSKLQEFSVDLRRSPARVLSRHPDDESTNFATDLWSTAARPGSPAPVETKTCPVPSNHRFGLHNDQNI